MAKNTGRPLWFSIEEVIDLPHTLTYVIMMRQKYDSFSELSEPVPEAWWDYPHLVREHIEKLYPSSSKGGKSTIEVGQMES